MARADRPLLALTTATLALAAAALAAAALLGRLRARDDNDAPSARD